MWQVSYSLVCVCCVMLRLTEATPPRWKPLTALPRKEEAALCVGALMLGGFGVGLTTRLEAPSWVTLSLLAVALLPLLPMVFCQTFAAGPGFQCPWVPVLPLVGMMFNIYLVAQVRLPPSPRSAYVHRAPDQPPAAPLQMHVEAWVRLVVVTLVAVGGYAAYGQYRSKAEYETLPHEGPPDGA